MEKNTLVATTATLSFVAGILCGFAVTKKMLKEHYDELANEEILDAKKRYSDLSEQKFASPEEAVEHLIPERHNKLPGITNADAENALKRYRGEVKTSVEKLVVTDNENARKIDEWNADNDEAVIGRMSKEERIKYEVELPNPPATVEFNRDRDPAHPYIITFREYDDGDMDFDQDNLLYFVNDSTLIDDRQMPLDETEIREMIGSTELLMFGHESDDPDIVYIRNEKISTDFMVRRSEGSYANEVAGLGG